MMLWLSFEYIKLLAEEAYCYVDNLKPKRIIAIDINFVLLLQKNAFNYRN